MIRYWVKPRKIALSLFLFLITLFFGSPSPSKYLNSPADGHKDFIPQNTTYAPIKNCPDVRPWPEIANTSNFTVLAKKQAQEIEQACRELREISKDEDHPYTWIALAKISSFCFLSREEADQTKKKLREWIKKFSEKRSLNWRNAPLELSIWNLVSPEEKGIEDVENFAMSPVDKQEKENALLEFTAHENANTEAVKKSLEFIKSISPRLNSEKEIKTWEQMILSAQDANLHNEPDKALKFLKIKREISGPERWRKWFDQKRLSLRLKNDRPALLNLFRAWWRFEQGQNSDKHLLHAALLYARALWTNHQTAEAIQVLNKTKRQLSSIEAIKEVHYLLGRIEEEKGKIPKAIKLYEQSKSPATLWNLAWIEYKNGLIANAILHFDEIIETPDQDQGKRSQATFWKGRSLFQTGQIKSAEAAFKKVIEEDPNGYYGFLAARQLQTPIPALKNLKVPRAYPPSEFDTKLFYCLTKTEDLSAATSMLLSELPLTDKNQTLWVDYLPLYAEARAYNHALSRISAMPNKEKQPLLLKSVVFLYPILYSEEVTKAAQKTQVRPEYIWAIMRQESNFNPLARSPTGAIGLMQLMPQVAKNLLGTNATEEELRAPELNIALGARHLKEYLDRFRGNFVLSTAAYNASPETVKNWLKSRSHKDPTLFIEDIPYEETRNYVKLVIRNFINYTRQTTQDQEIEFPQMIFANAGAAKNDHE